MVDFLFWKDGEPDYPEDEDEFFVLIDGADGWDDKEQYNPFMSVCQLGTGDIKLSNNPAYPLCTAPFTSLGGRCVYVLAFDLIWYAACRSMCAGCTLASIHNQEELNMIWELVYSK